MGDSRSGMNTTSKPRSTRSKAGHSIMITPASPANSPSTLIQSTSDLTSASTPSPPLPVTPPQSSRPQSRYQGLGHGHVPLHRRGTSKTYERLEDLLREAGYKETRIFTPEGEHVQARTVNQDSTSKDQQSGVKNGMGAFVDFLTGLMPNTITSRSTSSLVEANSEERHAYSPPVSPLSRRQGQKQKQGTRISTSKEPQTPSTLTSSIESLDSGPRSGNTRQSNTPVLAPEFRNLQHSQPSEQQNLRLVSSRRSPFQDSQTSLYQYSNDYLSPDGPSNSQDTAQQPHTSRASAYLRHIASAPNMAATKRPSSTSITSSQSRKSLTGNISDSRLRKENRQQDDPPLPGTWLESVARAVLFGGVGAYIGGPPSAHAIGSTSKNQLTTAGNKTLRSTRSAITSREQNAKHTRRLQLAQRSALSDRGNTNWPLSSSSLSSLKRDGSLSMVVAPPRPPELFSQLQRGRSTTSVSKVSQTRVVCRSAPASRASSAIRGSSNEGKEGRKWYNNPGPRPRSGGRGGKERGPGHGGKVSRGRQRATERDRLPSLADTRAEGDDEWAITMNGMRGKKEGRGLTIEVGGDESGDDHYEEDHMSSDEGEESELDLARILVPPKRQNSIKSLRKHLAAPSGPPSPTDETVSSKLMKAAGVRPTLGRNKSSRGGQQQQQQHDADPHYLDGSETENWGSGWVGSRRDSADEGDYESIAAATAEGFMGQWSERSQRGGGLFGSGRSAMGRNIPRIPGPWSIISGGDAK